MRGQIRGRLLAASSLLVAACTYGGVRTLGSSGPATVLVASLILGAFVGLIVSTLAMRGFDQAVRPLTEAARLMYEGDLTVRARIDADEDVGKLGAAFDKLAGSLSRSVGELRAERDLVSHILDGMQEGVLLLDEDGKVALMNPALREMLLLRADQVGHPLLEVVRHAELKELLDRARTTRTTCSGEVELGGLKPRRLLVRGTAFSQRKSLSPGRSARGHAVTSQTGMLAVFFDVTDIRRLESLRRDFVANVSHELRTPVTAILSAAETMNVALSKDPEGARVFLAMVERNAARLQRLIEDLLDLSRIESRELRLRHDRFAFEPFAAHLLGMFRERADKRKITLSLASLKGLQIDADRRALEQVLTNLVDNAVKYCPEGSTVTLRASLAEAPQSGVHLRVEDDGAGIEEKHFARLFERFYRVDAGRSREMGGTGLGLSIVKHLVEAMGGAIEVASTVGQGTTFDVTLPHAGAKVPDRSSGDVNRDGAT